MSGKIWTPGSDQPGLVKLPAREILAAVNEPVKPEGWDPRRRPDRHCPIHKRLVMVDETCPVFCGKQYCEECKFADRDPRPEEMMVATPLIAGKEEDAKWVQEQRRKSRQ